MITGVNFLFNHPLCSYNSCYPSFLSKVPMPYLGVHLKLFPWVYCDTSQLAPATDLVETHRENEFLATAPDWFLSILEVTIGTHSAFLMLYSLCWEAGTPVIKLVHPLCSYLSGIFQESLTTRDLTFCLTGPTSTCLVQNYSPFVNIQFVQGGN